jgi:hypothetical protein
MSTPAALYRNAIDLNRYSNSVARRVMNAYNDIIIDATNQLRVIDDLAAPDKAARLRSILAQLKESLATWAGDATEITALELQGLTELQSEFVTEQLRKVLPPGARDAVRTVEISPQFAQSVVTTDPTQLNVVALSDDLFAAVQGAPATFSLTAAKGATITLPNGEVIQKAFRGIATDQAERFSQVVRNGLLTGETTPAIAKRMMGRLERNGERLIFGEVATRRISKKYRYIATLDSRTSSPICRALDNQEFPYGKRANTAAAFWTAAVPVVAVIDYKGLGHPAAESDYCQTRASAGWPRAHANTSYGQWLKDQPLKTQQDVLGASKVPYFNRLVEKYGATRCYGQAGA